MCKRVLLPIDIEHKSSWRKALPAAVKLCGDADDEMRVLTVITGVNPMVKPHLPESLEEAAIADAEDKLRSIVAEHVPTDINADIVVKVGSAYRRILDEARQWDADVIVMASHRPEMEDYLLGSNAARVVRHAESSVYIVR